MNKRISIMTKYDKEPQFSPRWKTPCHRTSHLEKHHGHSPTYRDPEDPREGVIKLNSYLGLDGRGHRALSCLKTMCKTKYVDE